MPIGKRGVMTAKDDLMQFARSLSEYECAQVVDVFRDVAEGRRFWEGDLGLVYDEYTKLRFFKLGRNPAYAKLLETAGKGGPFVPIPVVSSNLDRERTALPVPPELLAPLSDVIRHRRSRRDYSSAPMSIDELSALLYYGCGTTGFVDGYGYDRLPLRAFPSHGGLQSPEVYLAIERVSNVPAGLYHYQPVEHSLESLLEESVTSKLKEIGFGESHITTAPIVLFITGRYDRLRWKYGERSYRFMCMDAGFAGENVYLAGEALGLGVCAVSGFAQDLVEVLLDLRSGEELPLLLISVGRRA
jgi:SagB-type dehydrogenase family enzyme